jgi:hypothetical protein
MGSGDVITLDLQAARRANAEIRYDYGIDQDRYLGPGATSSPAPRRRR